MAKPSPTMAPPATVSKSSEYFPLVSVGFAIGSSYLFQSVLMDTRLWLVLTGILGAGVPLGILVARKIRRERGKG